MDTADTTTPTVATTKTVAQIAQEILGSSTSSADERRLAAWVLNHDEATEAAIASQARLADRLDAQAKRARQRAAAAGGAVVQRLAGAAGVTAEPETQHAETQEPAADTTGETGAGEATH